MQEEPDEDSQCLSDDTDTEISTQVSISEPLFIHLQPLFKTIILWMLCYILGCMAVHRVPKIQHTSPEVLCSVLGSKEELV